MQVLMLNLCRELINSPFGHKWQWKLWNHAEGVIFHNVVTTFHVTLVFGQNIFNPHSNLFSNTNVFSWDCKKHFVWPSKSYILGRDKAAFGENAIEACILYYRPTCSSMKLKLGYPGVVLKRRPGVQTPARGLASRLIWYCIAYTLHNVAKIVSVLVKI